MASKDNLLLIDACTQSFPVVLRDFKFLMEENIVKDVSQHDAGGVDRGFRKGWCVGRYVSDHDVGVEREQHINKSSTALSNTRISITFPERKINFPSHIPPRLTTIVMGYSTKRLKNYKVFLPAYVLLRFVEEIILIWNNQNVDFPTTLLHSKIKLLTPEVNF